MAGYPGQIGRDSEVIPPEGRVENGTWFFFCEFARKLIVKNFTLRPLL